MFSVQFKTLCPLLISLQISMNVSLVTHVIAVHRVRIRTDHMYVPVTEATPATGTPVEVGAYFSDISAIIFFFCQFVFRCLSTCLLFCLSAVCLSFLLYVSLLGKYFRHFSSALHRIVSLLGKYFRQFSSALHRIVLFNLNQ